MLEFHQLTNTVHGILSLDKWTTFHTSDETKNECETWFTKKKYFQTELLAFRQNWCNYIGLKVPVRTYANDLDSWQKLCNRHVKNAIHHVSALNQARQWKGLEHPTYSQNDQQPPPFSFKNISLLPQRKSHGMVQLWTLHECHGKRSKPIAISYSTNPETAKKNLLVSSWLQINFICKQSGKSILLLGLP